MKSMTKMIWYIDIVLCGAEWVTQGHPADVAIPRQPLALEDGHVTKVRSRYRPNQLKTTLQRYIACHWLNPCLDWPLRYP